MLPGFMRSPSNRYRSAGMALLLALAGFASAASDPRINEFLASNAGGLEDEDGDTPDWIEIHNPGPDAIPLLGWGLTDRADAPFQWRFPPTNLPPGGFLLVFASGKDRRVPGRPLHTSFRLSDGGEYLGLFRPGVSNAVSGFAPAFRPQYPGYSFGVSAAETTGILAPDAPLRARVPLDASEGSRWREPGFDDSAWTAGIGGAGYENAPENYAGLIGTDLRVAMANLRNGAFLRIPFRVDGVAALTGLRMDVQYDDGFMAWINGRPVAARNAPAEPAWDSAATADHPDSLAVVPEEIDLSAGLVALNEGTNILAVQILNIRLGSSDALFRASLEADRISATSGHSFFPVPTPGAANRNGLAIPGPILRNPAHYPAVVTATNPVFVTVQASAAAAPVRSLTLTYRVQFAAAATVEMLDDGLHGDAGAGDGVWGATIPAGVGAPGKMVRYRIAATDRDGRVSRLPLFPDPADSEEWRGFVVEDPTIRTRLEVLHLFVENEGASEGFAGTRCSIAFGGEFYDNVAIAVHGQSSAGFPKKSHNLDFPRDHRFRAVTNLTRWKDAKLMQNYGDKSRVHNVLAHETLAAVGGAHLVDFPVRVQRNGGFHGILDLMEDSDDRWLERLGRSPEGALYKVYDSLDNAGGSEKKTRREEGNADLQDLISNLDESRPLAARAAWAWDNVDLPECVSYCVGLALVSSQDHGHKNYFVCRDTPGTGEWSLFPWDTDLTFGRNWLDAQGYFTDTLFTNNVLTFYNASQQGKPANRFYNLLMNHPDFRRMYLRRLRTVLDELAPQSAPAGGLVGNRIRYWLDRMDPADIVPSDAAQDETRWGIWGTRRTTRQEAARILDTYLPGRRAFLLGAARLVGEALPAPQPTNPAVRIDAIDFRPASGNGREEFLRITNAEPVAVDLSGWALRGQIRHRFRPGTVVPAGRTLHVARDVAAFRARPASPRRGESVFVQGGYSGQLSARGGHVELVDPAGRVADRLDYAGNPTPAQQALRPSEVHFHPANPAAGSAFTDEDFEFLELANAGPSPLRLAGLQITDGVVFGFPTNTPATLAPGARLILARDTNAFALRYGNTVIPAGQYYGRLSNDGDRLRMEDAEGEVVFEFRYDPAAFPSADGNGPSLESRTPWLDLDSTNSWRTSRFSGGTPGRTGWPVRATLFAGGPEPRLEIPAEAGRGYAVESAGNLGEDRWVPEGTFQRPASDGTLRLPLPNASVSGPARFYRVVDVP